MGKCWHGHVKHLALSSVTLNFYGHDSTIYLATYLSSHLPSIYEAMYMSIYLSVIYLSIYLSVTYLSIDRIVCMYLYMYIYIHIYTYHIQIRLHRKVKVVSCQHFQTTLSDSRWLKCGHSGAKLAPPGKA